MEENNDLIEDGSSNERFLLLGNLLGMELFEIAGVNYTPLESAATIFGFAPAELKKLLEKHPFIVCKEMHGRIFVPYRGVLLGGMESNTEAGHKIMNYLLAAERTVRLGNALDLTKN